MLDFTDSNVLLQLYNKSNLGQNNVVFSRVIEAFKIFQELDFKLLNLSQDEAIFISGKEHQENFSFEVIFKLAENLERLKKYSGFSELLKGFTNPEQFSATIFEVDCMIFMLKRPAIAEIILSPEVIIADKIKRPEMKAITKDHVEIYCECKSLASLNRAKQSRAFRLIQEINSELQGVLIDGLRVEILFDTLPPSWNKNYGKQLKMAIAKMRIYQSDILTVDKRYKTYIKISNGDSPININSIICAANKPPQEKPTLVVGEVLNLAKNINNSIKDALTQLPVDKPSIIFLYSLNKYYAERAIKDFFKNNSKKYLLGIYSWTTDLVFYPNQKCITKIET